VQLLPYASSTFRKYMQRAATPGLTAALLMAAAAPQLAAADAAAAAAAAGGGEEAAADEWQQQQQQGVVGFSYTPAVEALLLPYFLEFCQQQYK
jgi:hypothetical protein